MKSRAANTSTVVRHDSEIVKVGNRVWLDDDWTARVSEIGPELAKLETHAERVALLIGCAAVFAREAGLTDEEFREVAEDGWLASSGSTL